MMKKGQNDIVNTNHFPPKLDLPYEAPYGYFDHLPNRVKGRLSSSTASKSTLEYGMRWAALAAVMVFVVGLVWRQWPVEQTTQVALSELSPEEINNYLLAHSDVPALLVLAEREQINWQFAPDWQMLSDNDLLPLIEDAELLNAMEEL